MDADETFKRLSQPGDMITRDLMTLAAKRTNDAAVSVLQLADTREQKMSIAIGAFFAAAAGLGAAYTVVADLPKAPTDIEKLDHALRAILVLKAVAERAAR